MWLVKYDMKKHANLQQKTVVEVPELHSHIEEDDASIAVHGANS